ncbi:phosphatase PAP2 family protein [Deinococcus roseus]|nr:phosphatase PAP2 family protein [Deinococcus roseus]
MSNPVALHWKRLLVWVLGVLLPLLGVGLIAEDLLEKERFRFEQPFMLWLHSHANASLDRVAVTASTVGSVYVMGGFTLLLVFVLWEKNRRISFYFLLSTLGAAVINSASKLVFGRPRPHLWEWIVQEQAQSFPSGHAMYAAAVATALVCMLWHTRYRWPMVVLGGLFTFLVGLSRMYLGVHYPTDVLAGWAAGMAWSLACWRVVRSHASTDPERTGQLEHS